MARLNQQCRALIVLALIGCICMGTFAASPPAVKVLIASPQPQAVVKGPLTFTVQIANMPTGGSVAYRLNGQPLGGPIGVPPYRFDWHSGLCWDGPAMIQAVVNDATGKELAESPVVPFTINNLGGSLKLTSPDPTQVLHGKVKWSVEGDRAMTDEEKQKLLASQGFLKTTEALVHFLDGRLVYLPFGTSKASYDLDTTRLANGRHELLVSAWAFKEGIPPYGMLQVPILVDNGHAVRDVRPRWRDLFLAPGQQETLDPRVMYTDGTEEPLKDAVLYSSSDAKVATVNEKGAVTAVAPGIATITLDARGCKTTTRAVVDPPHGFPHFSRDGQILTTYDLNRSLFVRTLFNLGPDFDQTPGMDKQVKGAGINALTSGFYQNPADGGHQPSFDAWKTGWDPWWSRTVQQAKKYDLGLVLTGDDIARTANELHDSVTNPWAPDAIQYAFSKARDSKQVICVEMVDEISFLWGGTPKPTDGRWQKQQPPVPDDAFSKLMRIINGVPNRPPLSWPIGGVSGSDVAHNWMGDPAFADYTSHYWDVLDWRKAFPDHASLPQTRIAMDHAVVDRLPQVQRATPALLLVSLCSQMYRKPKPGEFTPDEYRLQNGSVPPALVSAEIMYAATMGMAGVRAYALDTWWNDERQKAHPGDECQVGSSPVGAGSDRWQAMSSAFNLIKRIEPYLLQAQMHAIDLGPSIVTGARLGKESRLLMAVNFSQTTEPAQVDLRPYHYGKGASIVRYRLLGATLRTDILADTAFDKVTFAPGETVVWLCQPIPAGQKSAVTPPELLLTAPQPDETVSGKIAVKATAVGKAKIDRVEFAVDGVVFSVLKKAPYEVMLDTTSLKAGLWHSLTATAYDTAGNSSEERIALRTLAPAQ